MNKRIQQLAKQAYEDVIKHTPSFLVTKELYEQKFAELIVRECIGIVQKNDGYRPYRPGKVIVSEIKQHFGVEE